jgi:hypothetical protein
MNTVVFLVSPSKSIIQQIADEIDSGYDCYYGPETGEFISVPHELTNGYIEEEFKEAFKDDIDRIEQQKASLIKFEPLESFESFKIMEAFVDQLSEDEFQLELGKILQRNKAFRNFKNVIDHSMYRQEWFDFKFHQLEQHVTRLLNAHQEDLGSKC